MAIVIAAGVLQAKKKQQPMFPNLLKQFFKLQGMISSPWNWSRLEDKPKLNIYAKKLKPGGFWVRDGVSWSCIKVQLWVCFTFSPKALFDQYQLYLVCILIENLQESFFFNCTTVSFFISFQFRRYFLSSLIFWLIEKLLLKTFAKSSQVRTKN